MGAKKKATNNRIMNKQEIKKVQEQIWQSFIDELLLDDKEFNSFDELQWRKLKKILYPLTHQEVRDFIPMEERCSKCKPKYD